MKVAEQKFSITLSAGLLEDSSETWGKIKKKNKQLSCKVEADVKCKGIILGQRRYCLCIDLYAEMSVGAIPCKKISVQYLFK